jgi:hypothetical protein
LLLSAGGGIWAGAVTDSTDSRAYSSAMPLQAAAEVRVEVGRLRARE